MRTTVDIPAKIYRQLKLRANRTGCSLREGILRALEAELCLGRKQPGRARISLPIIKSKRPGWLKLDNKAINQMILF